MARATRVPPPASKNTTEIQVNRGGKTVGQNTVNIMSMRDDWINDAIQHTNHLTPNPSQRDTDKGDSKHRTTTEAVSGHAIKGAEDNA
jgi:hypothetical protein